MNTALRRIIVAAIASIGVAFFLSREPVQAQPGAGAPPKIGVVDLNKLLTVLHEAKEINAGLAAKKEAAQKSLDEVVTKFEEAQKDLKLIADRNTDDFRAKLIKAKELETLAQARKSGLEQVIDFETGIVTADMYIKVAEGVKLFGVQNNYDLIVVDDSTMLPPRDKGSAGAAQVIQMRQVMFASARMDISDQVAVFMNNRFKAGIVTPPPAPAPAPANGATGSTGTPAPTGR